MAQIILNDQCVEIDDMCVELVKLLNAHGFKTQFCCQGHTPYEDFMIIFDRSVTDGMIYELAKAYETTNDYLDEESYPMYPFMKWVRYQRILENNGLYSGYLLMENWEIIIQAECIRGDEECRKLLSEDLTKKMKIALESLKLIQLTDIKFDECNEIE